MIKNYNIILLSIKTKMSILFSTIIFIIALFIYIYFPQKFEVQLINAAIDKIDGISEMTAYSISPGLYFNDSLSINEAIYRFKQNKEIRYLIVENNEGNIYSSFGKVVALKCNYKTSNKNILKLKNDTLIKNIEPIYFQSQKIGTLYIGTSLSAIRMNTKQIKNSIATLSLILLIFGVLFIYLFTKLLTNPLYLIIKTIKEISLGDLSKRVRVTTKDEVGFLADSLNQMIGNLESANKKLLSEIDFRNQTEMELIRAKEKLTKALEIEKEFNELKNRFISMVSHEYRTPLTIIFSTTYLLENFYINNQPDEIKKYLSRIRTTVDNMTSLLENVIKFGKFETILTGNNIQKLNCLDLLNDLINFQKSSNPKNVHIEFNHDTESKEILIDYILFNHIFSNLINNAVIYSENNGKVIINLFQYKDYIKIEVIDFGIGIPQGELQKIYDPFFRCSNVTGTSGTGLGLSIVKKGIESMGAKIFVESGLGSGSKFTVYISDNNQKFNQHLE